MVEISFQVLEHLLVQQDSQVIHHKQVECILGRSTNTSSSGSVYIKIVTLSISQSARFSIELIGRSTSYGDGNTHIIW